MKKISLFVSVFAILFLGICSKLNAQSPFYQAIKTCEEYAQIGSIKYKTDVFNLEISLEKGKNDKCIYKEKIYQDKNYQMLTCNFEKAQLPFLSSSMEKYNKQYSKEIAKNSIFEAKMTTNAEIFQKYLVDKNLCRITHSKKQ